MEQVREMPESTAIVGEPAKQPHMNRRYRRRLVSIYQRQQSGSYKGGTRDVGTRKLSSPTSLPKLAMGDTGLDQARIDAAEAKRARKAQIIKETMQ